MHAKSELRNHIINFVTYIENHFKTIFQTIQIDNKAKFAMKIYLLSKGIIHQTTCVETPEQNEIVKRKHQHLLNVTCVLLFQANLPFLLRNFATQHATLLINCIHTPLLNNVSPYEIFYNKLCDISILRVFGCLCYFNLILLLQIEKNLTVILSMVFFLASNHILKVIFS